MNIETLKEILVAVAPVIGTIVVTIIALVRVYRHVTGSEARQQKELVEALRKQKKSFDDIAIIKAKLTSIEKCMSEKGRK